MKISLNRKYTAYRVKNKNTRISTPKEFAVQNVEFRPFFRRWKEKI
jgi:hypothetical protein